MIGHHQCTVLRELCARWLSKRNSYVQRSAGAIRIALFGNNPVSWIKDESNGFQDCRFPRSIRSDQWAVSIEGHKAVLKTAKMCDFDAFKEQGAPAFNGSYRLKRSFTPACSEDERSVRNGRLLVPSSTTRESA